MLLPLAHSCISCSDRARVVGGLPDVVAIQEGKVKAFLLSATMSQSPLLHVFYSTSLKSPLWRPLTSFSPHLFSPWTWLATCGVSLCPRWAGRRTRRRWRPTIVTSSSLSKASLPASRSPPSPRPTLASTRWWWRTNMARRPASSPSACTTLRKRRAKRRRKTKWWQLFN